MANLRRFACLVVILSWPAVAAAQQVFFGNLHSHTSFSDGTGTPEEAYKHARDEAKLDFLAITEHNHKSAESGAKERADGLLIATQPALYAGPRADAVIPTAQRMTVNGRFVALYGQEFSTISAGNHMNVFDVPRVIDSAEVPNGDFAALLRWLDRPQNRDSSGAVALLQFNHPDLFGGDAKEDAKEYGLDDFPSSGAWFAALALHVGLVEILNGPAMEKTDGHRSASVQEKEYFRYLNMGFRLAPSVGQDNHYRTWGTVTDARVAVIANALTKAEIMGALRARRVYATEDKNLRLLFRVNGRWLGDVITTLPAVGAKLDVRLSIRDDDEPDANYRVEVYSDVPGGLPSEKPIEVFEVEGNTNGEILLDGIRFMQPGQYVFLKVIQRAEHGPANRAWTAPVWFGRQAPSTPAGTLRIVKLLPDPEGDDLHEESITVRNDSSQAINLLGWSLQDLSGSRWSLSDLGTLGAGQEVTVKRRGQAMSLNNDGDTVKLLDPDDKVIQTVRYGRVAPGEVVRPRN